MSAPNMHHVSAEFTSLCSVERASLSLHMGGIGSLRSAKGSWDMVSVLHRAVPMMQITLTLAQFFKKDLAAKIKASQFINCSGFMEN